MHSLKSTLYVDFAQVHGTRALTFENFCQGGGTSTRLDYGKGREGSRGFGEPKGFVGAPRGACRECLLPGRRVLFLPMSVEKLFLHAGLNNGKG